jgi:hypothetical protein
MVNFVDPWDAENADARSEAVTSRTYRGSSFCDESASQPRMMR